MSTRAGARPPIAMQSLVLMNSAGFIALLASRVVLSLNALALGASAFEVGIMAAVNQMFSVVLSVPLGAYADRHGSRGLFLAGMLVAVLALLLPFLFPGMTALYFSAALMGLWAVALAVLTQTLVGQLSRPDEITRNYTTLAIFGSVALFSSPLIAGFAIDSAGVEIAWLVILPFMLFDLAWMTRNWQRLPRGRAREAVQQKGPHLLRDRRFVWILIQSGMVQLCSDLYPFFMPIYGHAHGLSASMIGIVVAAAAVSSFVARMLMHSLVQRVGEERLLVASLVVCAACFAAVPLFTHPAALILVSLAFGAGSSVGHPITTSMVFRSSPPGRQAETIGVRIMVNGAMRTVAPGVFGGIATLAGLTAMFLGTGLLIGGVAIANRLMLRRAPGARP
jgi:MFS family permease